MSGKKSADPSPESVARTNRQRLAQEEGVRALADFEQKSVAVRKNMERLRALRHAKEAEEASNPTVVAAPAKKKRAAASKVAVESKVAE
jgi:hypothetical protein